MNSGHKDGEAAQPVSPEELWSDNKTQGLSEPELVVDVAGFEGPLDLLLHLARNQKVDLSQISVVALAEQYIGFIDRVRAMRLELAADYLVMAAWLAFLKSKLLVPKQRNEEGESGEELAAVLQFRLKRLEAMREAAARLINRDRLGRDVFARGAPEALELDRSVTFEASLYDLLAAYAVQRQRQAISNVQIAARGVWSLQDARDLLVRLVGHSGDWSALNGFLTQYLSDPSQRRSVLASSFAASLELIREGKLEVRQEGAFAPIYMRPGQRQLQLQPRPRLVGDVT
ncbi:segregation/condensation protein A [Tianweitania sp. BSSL-BM11]|uniref:Segregation and condensation protein A n=1 Tax=Tianweitania aestuarii TaxID=2814886 RepID=A0ABS5RWK2_9HYPH|nr:ScpA family protein [Tianweitania aestuarii]MBS9720677.1 segregation/condensation protein A [Tianweitania aestuarii]